MFTSVTMIVCKATSIYNHELPSQLYRKKRMYVHMRHIAKWLVQVTLFGQKVANHMHILWAVEIVRISFDMGHMFYAGKGIVVIKLEKFGFRMVSKGSSIWCCVPVKAC